MKKVSLLVMCFIFLCLPTQAEEFCVKNGTETLFQTESVNLASRLSVEIPTEIIENAWNSWKSAKMEESKSGKTQKTLEICVTVKNPKCGWTITGPHRVYLTNGTEKWYPIPFFEDSASHCGRKRSGEEILLEFLLEDMPGNGVDNGNELGKRTEKNLENEEKWTLIFESGITSWETPQGDFSVTIFHGERLRITVTPDAMHRLCRARVDGVRNVTHYRWEVPGMEERETEKADITFRIPENVGEDTEGKSGGKTENNAEKDSENDVVRSFSLRVTAFRADGMEIEGETEVKLAPLPVCVPAEKGEILVGTCFYPSVPDSVVAEIEKENKKKNGNRTEKEIEGIRRARDGMSTWSAPKLPCERSVADYVDDFLVRPYGNLAIFWPLTTGSPVESAEREAELFGKLADSGVYSMTIYQHWGTDRVKRVADATKNRFFLNNNLGEYASYLYQGRSSAEACDVPKSESVTDCAEFFTENYMLRGVRNYQRDYPYVFSTSGASVANYELAGGVGFMCTELYAIGAQNLAWASSEMRGAARKWKPEFWGGWLAHEWQTGGIPYQVPQKFHLLRAGLWQQYLMGSSLMILESGAQTTQAGAYTAESGKRNFAYDEAPPIQYREEMRTFYEWVQKPENKRWGTPETRIALAMGNGDAYVGENFTGMPAWAQHETAKNDKRWRYGDVERSWKAVQEVFFPLGEDAVAPYKNRWLAGSPFGQVDVIGMDTYARLSDLTRYDLLIYAGWNTMTPETFRLLADYAKQGGTVILAVPHLSCRTDREGENYAPSDLIHGGNLAGLLNVKISGKREVLGTTVKEAGNRTITLAEWEEIGGKSDEISEDVEILERFGSDALVLRQKVGKGAVCLFLGWEYPGKEGLSEHYQHFVRRMAEEFRGEVSVRCDAESAPYISWAVYPEAVYVLNLDMKPRECEVWNGETRKKVTLEPAEMKKIER
ncbi:MAG: hypothetical protein Q4C70_06345 [Planctomycetia bacterium]|nr:hypothetical protein [Planctomycetia bacterium]